MWTYVELTGRADYEARLEMNARLAATHQIGSRPTARWRPGSRAWALSTLNRRKGD
jgi:hypothetical protein